MIKTTNIGLDTYEDNDVTSWLLGFNGNMKLIDNAFGQDRTDITKLTTDVSTLEQQMQDANDDINHTIGDVAILEQTTSGHTSQINGLTQQITEANANILANSKRIDSVADVAGTVYRGVLSTNEETLAITIGNFDTNTLVDVYSSVYGVNPLTVELREASGGQPNICVTTWTAQSVDIDIAIVIRNPTLQGGD